MLVCLKGKYLIYYPHDLRYRRKYNWYDTRVITILCGLPPIPSCQMVEWFYGASVNMISYLYEMSKVAIYHGIIDQCFVLGLQAKFDKAQI